MLVIMSQLRMSKILTESSEAEQVASLVCVWFRLAAVITPGHRGLPLCALNCRVNSMSWKDFFQNFTLPSMLIVMTCSLLVDETTAQASHTQVDDVFVHEALFVELRGRQVFPDHVRESRACW